MRLYLTRKKDKLHKLVDRVNNVQKTKGSGHLDKRQLKAKVNEIESLS
jgi:hypothetical protein